MTSAGTAFSPKLLTVLTLAVLLAHLAVLRTPVPKVHPMEPAHAFSTRTIESGPSLSIAPPQRLSPAARPPLRNRAVPVPVPAPALIETFDRSSDPEPVKAQSQPPADADQLALAPLASRDSAALASVDKIPNSVVLKYQVEANKFPYRLSAEMVWQKSGLGYEARLAVGVLGQYRVQTSRGLIGVQGLEPIRFSDKFRSEVAAHFVRAQGKVTFSANTPDVLLQAGAQDRLSVLIQLASLIASAPSQYPQDTTITLQTIGPRDADIWLFTVGETETLNLPNGSQASLKLVRNPRREFDQKVEVWLAPALSYMPARIRITESNGDFIDQKWLSSETPK